MEIKNSLVRGGAAIMLLSASLGYANDTYFTGTYVSVGVGVLNTAFKFSETTAASFPAGPTDLILRNNRTKLYKNSLLASLAVGYGFLLTDYFMLGAEALVDFQNSKQQQYFSIFESNNGVVVSNEFQIKLSNAFALVIKPGVLLGDTLGYAVIGARWGKFKVFSEGDFVLSPAAIDISTQESNRLGRKIGLTVGAGLEHYLCNRFSLAVEYNFTNYGQISNLMSSTQYASNLFAGVTSEIADIHSQTNAIRCNVVYRIG